MIWFTVHYDFRSDWLRLSWSAAEIRFGWIQMRAMRSQTQTQDNTSVNWLKTVLLFANLWPSTRERASAATLRPGVRVDIPDPENERVRQTPECLSKCCGFGGWEYWGVSSRSIAKTRKSIDTSITTFTSKQRVMSLRIREFSWNSSIRRSLRNRDPNNSGMDWHQN
jgi:hypothetical protein